MNHQTRLVGAMMLLTLISHLTTVAPAASQDLRLVEAVTNQDRQGAQTLLGEGVDVNTARADGATALLWAAHWDDLETATRLLRAGADPNAADDHGVTPLERAAENQSADMVSALLGAGANPNAAQTSGLTSLMVAARTGTLPIVTSLIGAGAEVNAATTETRSTALMWAVSEGHGDVAQVLLNAGADPSASTTPGFTPLMFAARNGDVPMTESLLAAGVDINAVSSDGTHILPFAILSGHERLAMYLLERGADPNGAMSGVHALHTAAGSVGTWLQDWHRRHGRGYRGNTRVRGLGPDSRLRLVKALLDRGADPNVRIQSWAIIQGFIGYPRKGAFEPFSCGTGDLRGATPLWVAAYDMNGSGGRGLILSARPGRSSTGVAILQALLDAGADPHLPTDDGTTPLMAAAGLGVATYTPREPRGTPSPSSEAAVRLLLDAGADINAVNEADFTALHGAAMRGANEVIALLVARGADIDARDFRGRTAYRMAEGSKQTFQFQTWPETARLLEELGADTRLGIPGTVQERLRDVTATDN